MEWVVGTRAGGSIELKREIECLEFIETIMEEITHHMRCLVIATVPIITSVLTYKEREIEKMHKLKKKKPWHI